MNMTHNSQAVSRAFVLAAIVLSGCGDPPAPTPDAARSDAPETFDLLLDTESLAFGDVCVDLRSEPVTLVIANASRTASPPIRASLAGADATMFEVASSSCGDGVGPRDFCSVEVVLAPVRSGALDASLELTAGAWSASIALEGRGVACDGLTLRPVSVDFGELAVGATSAPMTFTVTNPGDQTSEVLSASLTGLDAGAFDLVPGHDGCSGHALGSGASCTLEVIFRPTDVGTMSAALHIEGPALGVGSATLSGMGVLAPPSVRIDPASLSFGEACTGATAELVLTNDGATPTGPITLAVSGADAASFAIVESDCAGGLEPGASCRVTVRFDALVPGEHDATLEVSFDGGSASAPISATGGSDGVLTLEPSTADFGAVSVGAVSGPRIFTVRHVGCRTSGPLVVAIAGRDIPAFMLSADLCSGRTLAHGGSCTFEVTFAPTMAGSQSAAARAAASPGGTGTSSLTGTGE